MNIATKEVWRTMNGDNQLQVSYRWNWLSLGNDELKFKTSGEELLILEGFMEYTLIQYRKTKRRRHVSGRTWKH